MIKIGILLPRSSYYQSIGIDIFEGLKLGFSYLGKTDVKIITENVTGGKQNYFVQFFLLSFNL